MGTPPEMPTLDPPAIDLCDLDLFAHGFPHHVFDRLRAETPVWWHPPTVNTPGGEGFWCITRHADLLAVLHDAETFSSESGPGRNGDGGTTLVDMPAGFVTGVMMNMTDPPAHKRIRSITQSAFTPRTIALLDDWLRALATQLVDDAVERCADGETVDFLTDVAAELPLQTIAQLMGVPADDRHQLFDWTSTILDYGDRSLTEITDEFASAGLGLRAYGDSAIAARRAAGITAGADDLLGQVLAAHPPLSAAEEQAFFSLLFTAGSETTRNSIAGGVHAFMQFPDQWQRVLDDRSLLPTAVEEILRWTSATAYNRRTATRDVELGGQLIRAGEKTTHWYPSANRDEAVFADAGRFDAGRSPNPHVAFGHGIHHCLGASLARREITVMFDVLAERAPSFEPTGDIEWGRSNKHTSIRHLPLRLRGRHS
ncbi:MAG: cytochrome P450 [Acidimicrobiales bacterium]